MKPLLIFHSHLYQTLNLIEGRLLLIEDGRIREWYRATSGLPGYQTWDDQRARAKGPIPRQDQVGLKEYTVSTSPVYLPATPGVAGNFYAISPYQVEFPTGTQRADFGIHFDANVPGSAGCPVIRSAEGWEGFEKQMARLASTGLKSVPLQISYSF